MEKLKKIWIKLVKLCGWKFNLPEKGSRPEVERCVFVVAPHTSAWDFIIGATYLWSCCSNGKIFIAKEFFFWPLGPFLRGLGAISIDRKSHKDYMVKAAVEEFKNNKPLHEQKIKYFTKKYADPRKGKKDYDNDWDFTFNP